MSVGPIRIGFSNDPDTIRKIIELQRINLRKNLDPEEINSQGFVYVEHDPDTLQQICDAEPAVVAMDGDRLAGYAICMTKTYGGQVPELVSYFQALDAMSYQHIPLRETSYITCGQICIAKAYRGRNLMAGLYQKMKTLCGKYKYCVTEISTHNSRSLMAHYKVGFVPIHEPIILSGEPWQIVLWDWSS